MGKAYRTDVIKTAPIAAEIHQLMETVRTMPPETIHCPCKGCKVTYQIYNYPFSDRKANLRALLHGLRSNHPHHPTFFLLNEPLVA